ncbi:hypothetical protein PF008_g30835 [Phytophthora fragariae]|uniref:Secreted protein n=1 Tax=Phytophthora fragariae TaxID=53985 RepID=A0A6G0Q569_9STRA|nr:hypothetical protein PF008_g30835 [Phytophthora fragariae]
MCSNHTRSAFALAASLTALRHAGGLGCKQIASAGRKAGRCEDNHKCDANSREVSSSRILSLFLTAVVCEPD